MDFAQVQRWSTGLDSYQKRFIGADNADDKFLSENRGVRVIGTFLRELNQMDPVSDDKMSSLCLLALSNHRRKCSLETVLLN